MKSFPLTKNIKGKRIIVRVDFNVPIKRGSIEETYRIDTTLPFITLLLKRGAKVILISHIGDDGKESLKLVYEYLKNKLPISFSKEIMGEKVEEKIANLEDGQCLLLENLRKEKGEKENDSSFVKTLSSYADMYVNEAFASSHRAHASVVGIPKYLPSFAGPRFMKEIAELSLLLKKPSHPFVFLLGGAKFSTKLPLIKKFLGVADTVFIVGALANQFLKAKGYEVGKSLIDADAPSINALLSKKNLFLPGDVEVQSGKKKVFKDIQDLSSQDVIVDIGPETTKLIKEKIGKAKLVLWNGPTGIYEKGFVKPTEDILHALGNSKAKSVIGGGDTAALIGELGLWKKFSFVSTGGGATLDYLAKGTLPGISALQ